MSGFVVLQLAVFLMIDFHDFEDAPIMEPPGNFFAQVPEFLCHAHDTVEKLSILEMKTGWFVLSPIFFLTGSTTVSNSGRLSFENWTFFAATAGQIGRFLTLGAIHLVFFDGLMMFGCDVRVVV